MVIQEPLTLGDPVHVPLGNFVARRRCAFWFRKLSVPDMLVDLENLFVSQRCTCLFSKLSMHDVLTISGNWLCNKYWFKKPRCFARYIHMLFQTTLLLCSAVHLYSWTQLCLWIPETCCEVDIPLHKKFSLLAVSALCMFPTTTRSVSRARKGCGQGFGVHCNVYTV